MIHPEDTIVALSTPPGAGARAIVRLSGPAALACALGIFGASESVDPRQRRFYSGHVRLPELNSALPADLHVWPGPHSYTGQDVVELHSLSSVPLIQLLIAQLLNAGARAAQPGEFTMRAFLAGKLDLTRAEAVLGVIEAGDRTELRHALAQLAGGVTRPLEGLREDLLNLLADVEAGLDFSDEDIRFVDQEELLGRITKGLAQLTLLHKQLEQRGVDRKHFRVVLAGRPNAGKSSLFNALAPQGRALVSPEPGTTRDYLAGTLELEGLSLELIDTAGWQADGGSIEAQAQVLTSKQLADADLVVLCLDSALPATEREKALLLSMGPPQVLAVATKCDLQPAPPRLLATSALTGVDSIASAA